MTPKNSYEFCFRHRSDSYPTSRIIWELIKTIAAVLNIVFWSCVNFFVPLKRKSVKNEIVLITGSAGYIGRLLAIKLAKKGAKIVLWDINAESNEAVAKEINSSGGTAITYQCNLCDRHEVYMTAEKVQQQFGNPTILINNAGIVGGANLLDLQDEKIISAFNVNALAHFWTTKAFLPAMLEANHGHVVGIASILGTDALAGLTDYCSSKFAAVGFMQSIRREVKKMGKDGVHFTTVNPYLIDTELFQGVTIKFRYMPFLQILKPNYVADKIIDAIETNQTVLHIPRILYLTPVLASLLPVDAADRLHDLIGSNDIMGTFLGNGRKHMNGTIRELSHSNDITSYPIRNESRRD